MSGIAGIVRFDDGPIEAGRIEKMTAAMPYRGPDGINHWVRGSVALGHCMLRTTQDAFEEKQPLANEDETLVLVLDGWLSNWQELRAELLVRGVRLRSRADAELVLRAYEAWGPECLSHIDGDFAFVIWDARQRRAFCARDRVGNKPFNYHWDGTTLIFASELHAILAVPGVPESLNTGIVAELLAAEWTSRDETFWKGIFRLMAAHQMVVDSSGPHLTQYWLPDLFTALPYAREEEFIEHYRGLLEDTVRRMARSHAPLACEVSGGLDSSALFAVADALLRQGRLPAPGLDGYTLKFDDDSHANELDYSRAVAQHVGRPVHEVTPSRMSLDWYREQARHYRNFPSYPNGTMGLGIRAEARVRGSRVLMGGDGGDQWLCGSRIYYADALAARSWRELRDSIAIDRSSAGLPASLWWILRYGFYPLLPDVARRGLRRVVTSDRQGGIDTRAWLAPALKADLRTQLDKQRHVLVMKTRWVSQRGNMLTLSSGFSVFARELEERMAASTGIELRRPFFSQDMIQFSLSTPERWRLRGNWDKYLHRMALRGLLPETVRWRQSKAEFTTTFDWYRSQLEELLTSELPGWAGAWVDAEHVSRLVQAKVRTPAMRSVKLRSMWSLFACAAVDAGK
jgi:asparagine synthase (glutamine-hydrolysing)